MVKKYYPIAGKEILIKASKPHPKGTQYRVSIGTEIWDGENHEVVKVQMVYDGQVAGRKSPSYPTGTNDFERVMTAVGELEG